MRGLTPDMVTAFSAPVLDPIIFVSMTFLNEVVNVCTGCTSTGYVTWNGTNWACLPGFLSITLAEEGSEIEAKGMSINFFGLDPVLAPEVQNNFVLGLPITVYFGLWSQTTPGTLVDSPFCVGSWRMDQPTFVIGVDDLTLSIKAESRLIDMNVPQLYIYDNETQQSLPGYAGDLGFMFKNGLQNQTLYWGNIPGNYKVN